ncbi:MAG: peptide chain release factor N(5)-glutamine methyltransferase [bacterium]
MTVKEALDVSQRSVSGREAEIFLQEAMGVERSWLYAHGEDELTTTQETTYSGFLDKREQNLPVAYITGHKEFYGRLFNCDKRALIPRPETEGLIDRAVAWLPEYFAKHAKESNKPCPVRILELGTGCGNIAVTLALELAKREVPCQIVATDLAPEALELAQENWEKLKDTTDWARIHFVEADLFDHSMVRSRTPYNLIIANLPYVTDEWKFDPIAQPEVVFQEPDIALFGGLDGLDIYRRFFGEVSQYLANDGHILIEYGEDQTPAITPLAKQVFPEKKLHFYPDYAGLDRTMEIQ